MLRAQVDLDQLQVELGRGKLVLRNQLLNPTYLNEQLVRARSCPCRAEGREGLTREGVQANPAWEVKTGYVGSLTLTVPYTSLTEPCVVVLDELWLAVGPRQRPGSSSALDAAQVCPVAAGQPRSC